MNTIDLAVVEPSVEHLLQLVKDGSLLLRLPDGKIFLITEVVGPLDTEEDFADEIARTRQNKALMELLIERSKEPGRYTLDQVRERLGLAASTKE